MGRYGVCGLSRKSSDPMYGRTYVYINYELAIIFSRGRERDDGFEAVVDHDRIWQCAARIGLLAFGCEVFAFYWEAHSLGTSI